MGVDPRTTAFQRHRFKVGGRSPTDHRLVVDVGDGRNVGVNGRADGIGHVFKHNNRPAGGIGRGRLGSAVHNARFASIRRQERGQRPHNHEMRELSRTNTIQLPQNSPLQQLSSIKPRNSGHPGHARVIVRRTTAAKSRSAGSCPDHPTERGQWTSAVPFAGNAVSGTVEASTRRCRSRRPPRCHR